MAEHAPDSRTADPDRTARAPSGPGRPKDLAKRAAILQAAKALFAREGFAGVSMDRIAAEAGVSKLTVYSHFGDKESLFSESVRILCEDMLPDEFFKVQADGTLRGQLRHIAEGFFGLIVSDEAIRTHRIMVTPGQADQSLRRIFWEAGPKRTHDSFVAFLRTAVDEGHLEIDDLDCAAKQFFTLLKGELYSRMMCGVCDQPDADEVSAHLDATVEMFLRAYAPR
ncbi:TetR/AcrR family transcriptional regulator [Pseudoxanthomonas spadix]|uniref:TetR/AcrR family transcriptional regulator n=1 Tax=Pseudoxanthomonas spadix TaxID=415229 RepID=UPI000EFEBA58|nr:TetR/AcrR family transcriptional regulator [Pseudoxanthomonas spadix]MBP3974458.1 TetR/AcrR family transcriptional regulator [Pseudoxanthomonas spadix]RMW97065.1 TetR/AcrR family transcriptional regulator [Pseudoxanthomonas spadix]